MNVGVLGLLADQASDAALPRNTVRVAPKSFRLKEEVTYFSDGLTYLTPPVD